ncbi:NUDIX domain-containing protein [Paenibacillus sp. HN-1]|uniref:NUDIX hydrolase n=1 Tax=Paenibacillus TaxID=44249 RepID=UPI001CA90207|nr:MULTISPECIES: NUDIX domain-containing protein [Paenibacillus]MBY9078034.1 NUDIX domain-containing protein [Paenibacillus sp. CGMCC 1.18879]MBY9083775.1 NUDIX domain-containing protein [Paenibacillus sinensis]
MSLNVIDKIAWIRLDQGRLLCARSKGKDLYYLPGGKREPGESDQEALIREVREELSVQIVPGSIAHYGTFTAEAHGKAAGTVVSIACYTADYEGSLEEASEIEELAWLTYGNRDQVSTASQLIFDRLHEEGLLS